MPPRREVFCWKASDRVTASTRRTRHYDVKLLPNRERLAQDWSFFLFSGLRNAGSSTGGFDGASSYGDVGIWDGLWGFCRSMDALYFNLFCGLAGRRSLFCELEAASRQCGGVDSPHQDPASQPNHGFCVTRQLLRAKTGGKA